MIPFQPRWSIRLGGGYQEIEPVGDGTGDLLLAYGGGIQRISIEGEYRWRSTPFGAHWIAGVFDLDGDGRLEILTSNGREVIILSAVDGAILFRDSVGPPFSYGTYATMFKVHSFFGTGMQILVPCFSHKEVLMYDCSNGAENTRVLHRLWMDDGFHPSIAIGDVNHDGVDEIVIARLGGVYVFDPESGSMISKTLWNSDTERRRNYGHFALSDIDSDGDLEAIILSDKVTRHLAVLDNDGHGNFSPQWDRFIEHIYPADTTDVRYTVNSIRDVDGDGKPEIIVSLFNERKDKRWYTEVLDPMTGHVLIELPDQYLRGIQDADGDGIPELCLSHELARTPAQYSDLSIYSVKNQRTIWKQEASRFAERSVHPTSFYSAFKPDVFGEQEIWQSELGREKGLYILTGNKLGLLSHDLTVTSVAENLSLPFRIAHTQENFILVTQSGGSIIKIATPNPPKVIAECGYHLTTEAHISARPGIVPTIFASENSRYLAIPDFANNINVFRANGSKTPERCAVIRGRSRLGYDGIFHVASVIDTSSGPMLVVVDDEGLVHARLSLYSAEGERIRSFEFPDMPASIPGSRIGCYDWLYFRHSRGAALFVSFYQSQSMNSECSLAFLIATGEILWRKDRTGIGEYGRGVGPWGTSALRYQNGTPIAVFCAKDTLCELNLETGEFIRIPKLLTEYTADAMKSSGAFMEQSVVTHSSIEDPFTAYGTPNVHDDDLIIGGCFGGFGVIAKSGQPKWWHPAHFGDVLYRQPALGDIDGDGRLELGQGHADGTFRIYDYETGTLRASLALNAITTDILAIDMNSDGKIEFVTGTNDGRLLVIGCDGSKDDANNFSILAEYYSGYGMGSPIAEDLNGDGRAQIFVASADGFLTCFD
ncbi:MAG TPA: VCBS repeat-containing protein [Candidatus Kapabacteria bacterium]|jgi:hypothetical protein|nr:VCBS repeat-containing protein [Candidatus Kapabacteria bacterium]